MQMENWLEVSETIGKFIIGCIKKRMGGSTLGLFDEVT